MNPRGIVLCADYDVLSDVRNTKSWSLLC